MKSMITLIVVVFGLVQVGCAGYRVGEPLVNLPDREETVGFFSGIHTMIRDTERGFYDAMFGIRDGTDSFIYDVQKDYYEHYQK